MPAAIFWQWRDYVKGAIQKATPFLKPKIAEFLTVLNLGFEQLTYFSLFFPYFSATEREVSGLKMHTAKHLELLLVSITTGKILAKETLQVRVIHKLLNLYLTPFPSLTPKSHIFVLFVLICYVSTDTFLPYLLINLL